MSAQLEVFGLDALMRRMQDLEPKLAKKALRTSLRSMGKVYTREIKKRAGDLDLSKDARKTLMRAVYMQVVSRRGKIKLFVRIRKPDRRTNQTSDAYYWRWVEYGTAKRYREISRTYEWGEVERRGFTDARGGQRKATRYGRILVKKRLAYTGFIAPQPFVRPAAQAAKDWALRAFEAELRHHIDEAFRG